MDTVGKRLKYVIKSQGLTQQEVADRFGIDRSLLSVLCNDKQKISKLMLYALKAEFNVNPTWLLTGEGEMFLPHPTSTGSVHRPAPSPQGEGGNETSFRKVNGLSVHEGNVKEYPDIDDSDQIARTAWYRALSDESQYVINALDELRDPDALIALKRIALSAVAKQRAEKEAKLKSDELNEAMKKLLDDFMDEHEKDLRKKGEAG